MKIRWTWIAGATIGAFVMLAALAAPMADLLGSLEGVLPGWGPGGLVVYAPIYGAAPLLLLPTVPFSLGGGIIFGPRDLLLGGADLSRAVACAAAPCGRWLRERRMRTSLRPS